MLRKFLNGFIILFLLSFITFVIISEGVPLFEEYGYWVFIPIPIVILSYFIGAKVDVIKHFENED